MKKSRDIWQARADRYALQRDTLRGRLAAARSSNGTLSGQVSTLTTQVSGLQAQVSALTTENTGLKGSLPAQVAAVAAADNIVQLEMLVLNPAFANWKCRGSVFFGQTFISYDFNRRASDGTCF